MTNDDIGVLLHNMLGTASQGQASQTSGIEGMISALTGQSPQRGSTENDLVSKLAPAAMEFMLAKQSGADTKSAAMQAPMRALMSGNPLQASSPGGTSGGLIAQSIMKSLMGQ
jgi:hypothetical protein